MIRLRRVPRFLGAGLILSLAGCAALTGSRSTTPAATDSASPRPAAPAHTAPDRVSALIGLDPDGVIAALGPPAVTRVEPAGEAWLYAHANGCSIQVVLYPPRGRRKVVHATTETPRDLSESDCLKAIAAASP